MSIRRSIARIEARSPVVPGMAEQLILDLAQPERPTFVNFVAGANGEALAALSALAAGTSQETGLLLWGAHGAGKSHLLAACATRARDAGRLVLQCASPRELPHDDDIRTSCLAVIDAVDTADASITPGRSLLPNTMGRSCAPVARITRLARIFHISSRVPLRCDTGR